MPPQLEKNHVVPTAWQDEALARDGGQGGAADCTQPLKRAAQAGASAGLLGEWVGKGNGGAIHPAQGQGSSGSFPKGGYASTWF